MNRARVKVEVKEELVNDGEDIGHPNDGQLVLQPPDYQNIIPGNIIVPQEGTYVPVANGHPYEHWALLPEGPHQGGVLQQGGRQAPRRDIYRCCYNQNDPFNVNALDCIQSGHYHIQNGRGIVVQGGRNHIEKSYGMIIQGGQNHIEQAYGTILQGGQNYIEKGYGLVIQGGTNHIDKSYSSMIQGGQNTIPNIY